MQRKNLPKAVFSPAEDTFSWDHLQRDTDTDGLHNAAPMPAADETDVLKKDKNLPEKDSGVTEPLPDIDPKPFVPFDITAFNRSFFQKEPPSDPLPSSDFSTKEEPPRDFLKTSATSPESGCENQKPEKVLITDQQLRALSRKHLLMMIRDLEKELLQVKEENEHMIQAYQAGLRNNG